MPKSSVERLRGFRDFLPESMALRNHVIGLFENIFQQYGFLPLETPSLEYAATFEGKSSEEAETLMYKFEDRGNRRVGLRYDLTVPLARVVAMHPDLPIPFKRYHIAPVWRAERPQRGRYREFWQCDVDIVGSDQPAADAEILTIVSRCLTAIGFREYSVLVNDRRILSALARQSGATDEEASHIYRSIDKLSKIGADGVREEMLGRGLGLEAANKVLDIISIQGTNNEILDYLERSLSEDELGLLGVRTIRSILDLLPYLGADSERYVVDPTLARGLDYYTGTVFETVVDEPNVGSVTGGGRYDELVGTFAGRDLPTVGTSLGLERILEVLAELHLSEALRAGADVFVTVFDESTLARSLQLATQLRDADIATEIHLGKPGNIRRQLAYANKLAFPYVVLIGPDEIARNEVVLRDMSSGKQQSVLATESVPLLHKLLHPEKC